MGIGADAPLSRGIDTNRPTSHNTDAEGVGCPHGISSPYPSKPPARSSTSRLARLASTPRHPKPSSWTQAAGRVLARPVQADRDYPPFNRSARDGFAVRAADVAQTPARLRLIGQTRAGEPSRFHLQPGETVEIMTGAPGPAGADAVVMVEYSRREGDAVTLEQKRAVRGQPGPPGQRGSGRQSRCSKPEHRLTTARSRCWPLWASREVSVFRKPRVAILSTGDEVVALDATPEPFQIRNSNAYSLAAQVRRRGGEPVVLPVAPDELPVPAS